MSATIIDSLLVTLGLDSSNYKKGEKEAAKATKATAESLKKSAEQMTKSLLEVGRTVAALFLGFESIKGFTNLLGDVNASTADLGRTAADLGMSAHELNTWGNAVELAGGKSSDAVADFTNLSKSITNFQTSGEVSPLILFLQRMNIAVLDGHRKARALVDIFKDLTDKLHGPDRRNAFNLAQQAGISKGMLDLLLREKSERESIFRTAEANNNIDQRRVEQADRLQRQWRAIGQEVKNFASDVLDKVTPAVQGVFEWVTKTYTQFKDNGGIKSLANIFNGIWTVVKAIGTTLKTTFDLIANSAIGKWYGALVKKFYNFAGEYGATVVERAKEVTDDMKAFGADIRQESKNDDAAQKNAPRNIRNNNPGNIKATGNEARDKDGFAIYGSQTEGVSRLDRQLDLYAKRGIDTIKSIVETYEGKDAPGNHNNIENYEAFIQKRLGRGKNDQLGRADRTELIRAIADFEGARGAVRAQDIARVVATPGAAARISSTRAPTAGASTTTVHVDKVEINAPKATNADQIAREIPGAMKRRGVVAQADTGQS